MIALGAIANLASLIVTIVTSLWISPRLVSGLGDNRYGTWTLIAQLTGYFGILDFGTRNAVSFFVAQYLARGDQAGVNRIASTAFGALLKLGLAILALSAALAFLIPVVFHTPNVNPGDVRATTLVLGAVVGLSLPFDVFAATLIGARRQHFSPIADMATRLFTTVLTAIAISQSAGLPLLGLIQLSGRAITWLSLMFATFWKVPSLRIRPSLSTSETFTEIRSFGEKNFIINLALLMINRMDTIVIGWFLGPGLITVYAIGQQLSSYTVNVVTSVSNSFSPQFNHLAATGDHARNESLLLSGTRLLAMLTLAMVVGLGVFGSAFIGMWQQQRFVTGDWHTRSDVVLWLLLAGQTPRMLQQLSWQYLYANQKVSFLAKAQSAEAVANMILSLVLVRFMGLPGVALGSLVPLIVNHVFVIPRFASQAAGVSLSALAHAFAVPAQLAVAWFAIGWGLVRLWPPSAHWPTLLLEVGFLGLVMGTSALLFGFRPVERAWVAARLTRLTQGSP